MSKDMDKAAPEAGEVSAQEELRRIYALSLDMVGVAGYDGYFKRLSASWETTLGFTREELCAKPYLEFVHPDDRERTIPVASQLANGQEVLSFENRYRCRDGSYRWLEWNSRSFAEEQLIYFTARDVTQRKRMQDELVDSAERLQSILDSVPGAILTLDREGVIQSVNRGAHRLTTDVVAGRKASDLMHPEDVPSMGQIYEQVLQSGEPATHEIRGSGAESATWYEIAVGPLRREGQTVGLTLVTTDITRRKKLEQEVSESLARLKAHAQETKGKNRLLEAEIAERQRAEATLLRQQEAIVAMSTPIIKAWDGVLALPVIGAVDRARAALIMEHLLAEIVQTGARFAILDLTGVDVVDNATAGHLFNIATAAGLLGSRCLVSGISPSVAKTMVEMDAAVQGFATFGELQDALRYALTHSGVKLTRSSSGAIPQDRAR
jgi:PAS domain S-box-containing protein